MDTATILPLPTTRRRPRPDAACDPRPPRGRSHRRRAPRRRATRRSPRSSPSARPTTGRRSSSAPCGSACSRSRTPASRSTSTSSGPSSRSWSARPSRSTRRPRRARADAARQLRRRRRPAAAHAREVPRRPRRAARRWSTSCSTRRSATAPSAGSAGCSSATSTATPRSSRTCSTRPGSTRRCTSSARRSTAGFKVARGAPRRDRGRRRGPRRRAGPVRGQGRRLRGPARGDARPTSPAAPATCSTGPAPRPAPLHEVEEGRLRADPRRAGRARLRPAGRHRGQGPADVDARDARRAARGAENRGAAVGGRRLHAGPRPDRRRAVRRSSATTSTASSTPRRPEPATLEAAVRLARLLALASLAEREVEVDAAAIARRADRDPRAARGRPQLKSQLTSISNATKAVWTGLDTMRSNILARVTEAEAEIRTATA